jgi:integrase
VKHLRPDTTLNFPRGRTSSIVLTEANSAVPLKGDFERMARRRFQDPTPKIRGGWWTIQVRTDEFVGGKYKRMKRRVRIAPADWSERRVLKEVSEYLRPMNRDLQGVGGAVNFKNFVNDYYLKVHMPLLAETTQGRYQGVLDNYLLPEFGQMCLRDLNFMAVQGYFAGMASSQLKKESRDKIRDVLSSVMVLAVKAKLIQNNPVEGIVVPGDHRGKKAKPHISPEDFDRLLALIPEPYATMVFVAVWTGLRVSELIGLRWEDIHADTITVDERYCRGDWDKPKNTASNAPVDAEPFVIKRVHALKNMTVVVKWGGHGAKKELKVVKSCAPNDLVFQGLRSGKPMRDNNILTRFIKPAARAIGLPAINWRALRTSHATWMIEAGANPKDVQAQMRHSRTSTTMDIYAQFVPASQRRAIEKMAQMVAARQAEAKAKAEVSQMVN